MVIQFCCFQDYYSPLCLLETFKSVGMRRQSMSSTFVVFKDYQSLSSRLQMSPLLCKTSRSFVDIPDTSYALSFDRFH